MVIDLTPEQEVLLRGITERTGQSLPEVLTAAAGWLIEFERSHDASLERSIAQADRGEFIEEEEMDRRFARMMQQR